MNNSNKIKTNFKHMYLINSRFYVTSTGKTTTSGGYVGGDTEIDATERHLKMVTMTHGPVEEFIVTRLTLEGDYSTMLSNILNERD